MRCNGPNSSACSAWTIYDQYDTYMTLSHQQSKQETFFLSRPTTAQHIFINNILYIVSTPTCFNVSTLSSASLNLVLPYSYM